MSEWRYLKKNEVQHKSGFVLTLLAGDWSSPNDLDPSSPVQMSASESARLLREGLAFAEANAVRGDNKVAAPARTKKAPGLNTLSLRKKKEGADA